MTALEELKEELVTANHILAHERVLDSFGHVSARHPEKPGRYLLSRARAPRLAEVSDIMEFTLDGKVVGAEPGKPYSERFIHGAIYEAVKVNDLDRASALQEALTPLARAVTKTYGIGGLKAALEMSGFTGGAVRAPLQLPGEEGRDEIAELLREAMDASGKAPLAKVSEPGVATGS